MEASLPDRKEIKKLVQFLPRLYSEGYNPVRKWDGGPQEDGSLVVPWPDYDQEVDEFIREAKKECWRDGQYASKDVPKIIASEDLIIKASLKEIKSMLTYCMRGERFCDGYIASMIKNGTIKSILQRLKAILDEEE